MNAVAEDQSGPKSPARPGRQAQRDAIVPSYIRVSLTPAATWRFTFTFNAADRLVTMIEGTSLTTYAYTGYGALESEIVACGSKDLLTDPLGSLVKEISAGAALGSPIELYPYGTLAAGTPTTPYVYIAASGYFTDTADRDYVRARQLMKKKGRWMQVDPLWPLEPSHAYANSSPVAFRDPSGMACMEERDKSCDNLMSAFPSICNSPAPSTPYPPNSKAMAFVYCCNGEPYKCFCPGRKPRNPYILACVIVHERGHIPPRGCKPGHTGLPTKTLDECTALRAGIKCATEQCRGIISNDCIDLNKWRCSECQRLKFACNPIPPQSWLDRYCRGCGAI